MQLHVYTHIQGEKVRCEILTAFKNMVTQHSYVLIFSPLVKEEQNEDIIIPLIFDPSSPAQQGQLVRGEEMAIIEDFLSSHTVRPSFKLQREFDEEISFEVILSQTKDDDSKSNIEVKDRSALRVPPQNIDDMIKKIDRKLVELIWEETIKETNDIDDEYDDKERTVAHRFIVNLLKNDIALTNVLFEDVADVPTSIREALTPGDVILLRCFGKFLQVLGKTNVIKQDIINALDDLFRCENFTKSVYEAIISHKTLRSIFSRNDLQEIHNTTVFNHFSFFGTKELKSSANYFYYRKESAVALSLFQALACNLFNLDGNGLEMAETLNSIGCCYVDLLDFEKAYDAFERATKVEKNYAPVYNNYAYTLVIESETLSNKQSIRKKLQEALAYINDAILLNPKDVSFVSNRGYIEYELGDYARVLKDLERARELSSKYEDYSTLLKLSIDARIKISLENLAEAKRVFPDLLRDLETINENENSNARYYYEAVDVYNKVKETESMDNVNELADNLLLLDFYVSELLAAIAIHNPKQEIYYYTSMSSLQRVLNDEIEQPKYRLPIFNVNHMNDPREGKELEHALEEQVGKTKMIQELFKQLPLETSCRKKLETEFIFLKSFTKNDDSLPMWIHYADAGKGCCVKVSRSFFTNFSYDLSGDEKTLKSNPFDNDYRLYEVLYIKNGKISSTVSKDVSTLYAKVMSCCTYLSNIYSKMGRKTQDIILQAVRNIVRKLKYLIKSSDYSYEQEMRIVLWRPLSDLKRDDIDIRITPTSEKYPVPKIYVYTTKSISIEEIIFGPKVVETDDIVPFFAKKLLDLHNYDSEKVVITKSAIEYR